MMKRRHNRFLIAGLSVAALALGSFAPATTPAVAELPNAPAALSVVFDDGVMSLLEVVATPEHHGEQFMVLQGWAPGTGSPVGAGMIMPGATYVATPAAHGMFTTIVGESFMVTKGTEGTPGEF